MSVDVEGLRAALKHGALACIVDEDDMAQLLTAYEAVRALGRARRDPYGACGFGDELQDVLTICDRIAAEEEKT